MHGICGKDDRGRASRKKNSWKTEGPLQIYIRNWKENAQNKAEAPETKLALPGFSSYENDTSSLISLCNFII